MDGFGQKQTNKVQQLTEMDRNIRKEKEKKLNKANRNKQHWTKTKRNGLKQTSLSKTDSNRQKPTK